MHPCFVFFFFQAEDGIRDYKVTGVQTCALPIWTDRKGAYFVADMAKRGDVGKLAAFALDKMGKIDILINNAGTNNTYLSRARRCSSSWPRRLSFAPPLPPGPGVTILTICAFAFCSPYLPQLVSTHRRFSSFSETPDDAFAATFHRRFATAQPCPQDHRGLCPAGSQVRAVLRPIA